MSKWLSPQKFAPWFYTLCVLLLLAACGRKPDADYGDGDNDNSYYYRYTYPTPTPDHPAPPPISQAKTSRLVSCGSAHGAPAMCPEAVGVLFNDDADLRRTARCTGSMIAPNLFLTNEHCVEEFVSDRAADCSDRVFIHLPQSGASNYEILKCKSIRASTTLSETPSSGIKMDYAIIELQTSTLRKTFAVRNHGIPDQENLTAWVSNATKAGSLEAIIEPISLKNVQGSIYLKNHQNDFSRVIFLIGDLVVKGNSGAPILDADQNLVSVLQARIGDDQEARAHLFARIATGKSAKNLSLGTNLSCSKAFRDDRLPGVEGCDIASGTKADIKSQDVRLHDVDTLVKNVVDSLQKTMNTHGHPSNFFWSISPVREAYFQLRYGLAFIAKPLCVLSEPRLNERIELPFYAVVKETNDDEVLSLRIERQTGSSITSHALYVQAVKWKLNHDIKKPAMEYVVEFETRGLEFLRSPSMTLTLPSCYSSEDEF